MPRAAKRLSALQVDQVSSVRVKKSHKKKRAPALVSAAPPPLGQTEEPMWRSANGRVLRVRDMDTNHLKNSIAYVLRNLEVLHTREIHRKRYWQEQNGSENADEFLFDYPNPIDYANGRYHLKLMIDTVDKRAEEERKVVNELLANVNLDTKKGPFARTELETILLDALIEAAAFLDYCGYGDKWERGCAEEAGLPMKISKAIAMAEAS